MSVTKGISFAIEGDEVTPLDEPEGQMCAGIVICKHCTPEGVCGIDMDARHWARLPICPQKKWFVEQLRPYSAKVHWYDKDCCQVCGSPKHWRWKSWPYAGKTPIVCAACYPPEGVHPPGKWEYCSLADGEKKKVTPAGPKKTQKVRRTARVIRQKKPAQG